MTPLAIKAFNPFKKKLLFLYNRWASTPLSSQTRFAFSDLRSPSSYQRVPTAGLDKVINMSQLLDWVACPPLLYDLYPELLPSNINPLYYIPDFWILMYILTKGIKILAIIKELLISFSSNFSDLILFNALKSVQKCPHFV